MSWTKRQLEKIEAQGFDCKVDKYVCTDCVGDYAIKKFIEDNANEYYCDYCGRNLLDKDTLISIELEEILRIIVNGIRTEYGEPNDEGVGWDGGEGGWQGVTVYDTCEIIYDIYGCELGIDNEELLDNLVDSIGDQQWCELDPYALRRHEADYYNWELFCEQVKYKSRYVFFRVKEEDFYGDMYIQPYQVLDTIGSAIEDLNLILNEDTTYTFFRGRTHLTKDGYKKVEDLAPPHNDKALYSNRMSPAGIPMFYGALNVQTVIEEIRGSKRYASIGCFKNLRKLNLIDFTKIPELPSVFDEDNRSLRNAILFLNSFVKDLSKPIEKDKSEHIEYVPTQIVTEYFRRVYITENGEKIDGVIYPSSKVDKGKCCVLFVENADCNQDKEDPAKVLSLDSSSIQTGLIKK